jgi:hypothetical protein
MKKIIRLTESDLARIVRRVIRETKDNQSDLIGQTVNLYRNKNESQEGFAYQVEITGVEGNDNNITVTLDTGTSLTLRCTDSTGAFMMGVSPMYNKNLYSNLKDKYCTQMRDKRGKLKSVPNADFASTGGRMGNVG